MEQSIEKLNFEDVDQMVQVHGMFTQALVVPLGPRLQIECRQYADH